MFFLLESFVLRRVLFFVFLPSTVPPFLTSPDVSDGVVSEVFFFLGDFLGDFFEEVAGIVVVAPSGQSSCVGRGDSLFLHRFLEVSHGVVPCRFIHEEVRGVDGSDE